MIALFRFWPLHPEQPTCTRNTENLLPVCSSSTSCCIAGCTKTTSQLCCPTKAQLTRAWPTPQLRPPLLLPCRQKLEPCLPLWTAENIGTADRLLPWQPWERGTCRRPLTSHRILCPLAWRRPPVVTLSDSRPSKGNGTTLLHLPCCPARRRPSFLTTVTRDKTNPTPKRDVSSTQRTPTTPSPIPETQAQSTARCLHPRYSPQSACLIFQAPRRRLLFAITWYDPPVSQASSATLYITREQL